MNIFFAGFLFVLKLFLDFLLILSHFYCSFFIYFSHYFCWRIYSLWTQI